METTLERVLSTVETNKRLKGLCRVLETIDDGDDKEDGVEWRIMKRVSRSSGL